jgi:AcrR family transcriptional regulator
MSSGFCNNPDVEQFAYRGRDRSPGDSRERILEATSEVLDRRGMTKLNLSSVAEQAGLSRMTIYRFFGSKDELIAAFTRYESDKMEESLLKVTAGLRGVERVDATLKFMVKYQQSYPGLRMLDVEPGQVLIRLAGLMPALRQRLTAIIPGPRAELAASSVIRIALSHYVMRGDDEDQFLAQLRHAAGLGQVATLTAPKWVRS